MSIRSSQPSSSRPWQPSYYRPSSFPSSQEHSPQPSELISSLSALPPHHLVDVPYSLPTSPASRRHQHPPYPSLRVPDVRRWKARSSRGKNVSARDMPDPEALV